MPRRPRTGEDNPKKRGKAPPFWSLGVQGRDRNAPAVLLGDTKGEFSHVRESPPFAPAALLPPGLAQGRGSDEARTRFPASHEPPYGDSQEPCLTSDPMRLRRGWRQRVLLRRTKIQDTQTGCPVLIWSGRRGSNSLPPPWQGGALPDELRPRNKMYYTRHFSLCQA